jgi:Family of unknown function (DUF6272)
MPVHSIDLSHEINEAFFITLGQLTGNNLTIKKRVTEITIELYQNIRKHAVTGSSAKLELNAHASHYAWNASNTINAAHVPLLAQKINHINCLEQSALKAAHTKILAASKHTSNPSPGLGLYRIALRSRAPLNAIFRPRDSDYVEFSLHVNLAIPS